MRKSKKVLMILASILAAIIFIADGMLFFAILEDRPVFFADSFRGTKKPINTYDDHEVNNDKEYYTPHVEIITEKLISVYDGLGESCALHCDEKYEFTELEKYFKNLNEASYQGTTEDFDGDGVDEILLLFSDFGENWYSLIFGKEPSEKRDISFVVYGDTSDSETVFYYFDFENKGMTYFSPSWKNGILTFSSSDETYSLFAPEIAAYSAEINPATDNSVILTNVNQYIVSLGYSDIRLTTADVVYGDNFEIICVYRLAGKYYASIYQYKDGALKTVYQLNDEEKCALILNNIDGQQLMKYFQKLEYSSGKYIKKYSYVIFTLSEDGSEIEVDSSDTVVDDTSAATGESAKFFEKVNEFIANGTVCYDPFELTGSVSELKETAGDEEKYLIINDAGTSKRGVVDVDDNQWLNLRTGPGTNYPLLLIDSNNPESYVKQTKGSSVTVIGVSNINDTENPVWLNIQIAYGDKTLTGYSTAKYISLDDIRHESVGTDFRIDVSTNDSGCIVSSSDRSVIDINSDSSLRALRSGMAVITFKTDSGLTETCLIQVD